MIGVFVVADKKTLPSGARDWIALPLIPLVWTLEQGLRGNCFWNL
jgi:hypothetical protein